MSGSSATTGCGCCRCGNSNSGNMAQGAWAIATEKVKHDPDYQERRGILHGPAKDLEPELNARIQVCRCNRSSPMADAVCSADSTSPGSINCHLACARLAQTPARQSACSSTRTCKLLASAFSMPRCASCTFGSNPSRFWTW